jgi:hypothetical protein
LCYWQGLLAGRPKIHPDGSNKQYAPVGHFQTKKDRKSLDLDRIYPYNFADNQVKIVSFQTARIKFMQSIRMIVALMITMALCGGAFAAPPPPVAPPPSAQVPQACTNWFDKIKVDAKLMAHPPAPPALTDIGDPRYDAAYQYLLDLRRVQADMQKNQLRNQCQGAPGYMPLYQKVSDNLAFYEKKLDDHCGTWVTKTAGEHRDWLHSRKAIINKLNSIDSGLQARDIGEFLSPAGSPELGEDCNITGYKARFLRRDPRFKPLIETCVAEFTQYRAIQAKCGRRSNAPSCPKF